MESDVQIVLPACQTMVAKFREFHKSLGLLLLCALVFLLHPLKVGKSRKQFWKLSILLKNERKTWKNYPKSSQDNFFLCFVRFLEELRIPIFFEIYWPLEQFFLTVGQNKFGNKILFLILLLICSYRLPIYIEIFLACFIHNLFVVTYRVPHCKVYILNWLWRVETCKLDFVWRYLYIPKIGEFEFYQPVFKKRT